MGDLDLETVYCLACDQPLDKCRCEEEDETDKRFGATNG